MICAVVPLKGGRAAKSRLAPALDISARMPLAEAMAEHVLNRLAACRHIFDVVVLSPERPRWAGVSWRQDEGGGLNAELTRLRQDLSADVLVLHADLPLLKTTDVDAMLEGRTEMAIASDRHGIGTNALALRRGLPFVFAFGDDSFARHRAQAPCGKIVSRVGLALDVDTPSDLEAARLAGFQTSLPARP